MIFLTSVIAEALCFHQNTGEVCTLLSIHFNNKNTGWVCGQETKPNTAECGNCLRRKDKTQHSGAGKFKQEFNKGREISPDEIIKTLLKN
ncbi:MAG: hypothetical protein JSS91_07885 [Bacteroidetes bacterium]|nr:hypothetical protein [Bacteroidota bacterium]